MVEVMPILIFPASVLVVLEEEGTVGKAEADGLIIFIELFSELVEARVG
jgi:hypothetical protein